MSVKSLIPRNLFPYEMEDFFKPWNEWMDKGYMKNLVSMPSVNVVENGDGYKVSLAAPGLKKEDFRIKLEGDMLTISAEKKEEKEEKDEKFTRKEFNYSTFSRSFTLPEGVKPDMIDAKYENGLLNISIPKTEMKVKAATKEITVK